MNRAPIVKMVSMLVAVTIAKGAGAEGLQAEKSAVPTSPHMGGPVELVEAPNVGIADKRLLDGIAEVAWLEPGIEQPLEGFGVLAGCI